MADGSAIGGEQPTPHDVTPRPALSDLRSGEAKSSRTKPAFHVDYGPVGDRTPALLVFLRLSHDQVGLQSPVESITVKNPSAGSPAL